MIKQEPLKHYVLRQINFLKKNTESTCQYLIISETKQNFLSIVFTSRFKKIYELFYLSFLQQISQWLLNR